MGGDAADGDWWGGGGGGGGGGACAQELEEKEKEVLVTRVEAASMCDALSARVQTALNENKVKETEVRPVFFFFFPAPWLRVRTRQHDSLVSGLLAGSCVAPPYRTARGEVVTVWRQPAPEPGMLDLSATPASDRPTTPAHADLEN